PVPALQTRAVRHGLLTTVVLVVVLVVLGVLGVRTVRSGAELLSPLTARAAATVTATTSSIATVRFTDSRGRQASAQVPVRAAPVSPTTVAYDPADPSRAALPESPALVAADGATTHLAVLGLLLVVVLALSVQRVVSRARLRRLAPQVITVRRVRQQNRLVSRSWIELVGVSPTVRFPVYFDPALVTLDSPARLPVHGSGALRALEVQGRWVYPSGRVRTAEPKGRLVDNPSTSGADAVERARTATPLWRSIVLDAVLVVPAPFVGLFWVYLDGGGISVWLGATAVVAVTALWGASVLGTDPS
ncbi:MAG: hypothetical protein ABI181_09390, partial [Mycobacteriaceae bacterium]